MKIVSVSGVLTVNTIISYDKNNMTVRLLEPGHQEEN